MTLTFKQYCAKMYRIYVRRGTCNTASESGMRRYKETVLEAVALRHRYPAYNDKVYGVMQRYKEKSMQDIYRRLSQ